MLPILQNSSCKRIGRCSWLLEFVMTSLGCLEVAPFLGQHLKHTKCWGISVGQLGRCCGCFSPRNDSIHISSPAKAKPSHTPHDNFFLLVCDVGVPPRRGWHGALARERSFLTRGWALARLSFGAFFVLSLAVNEPPLPASRWAPAMDPDGTSEGVQLVRHVLSSAELFSEPG